MNTLRVAFVIALLAWVPAVQAAPNFWQPHGTLTPTPPAPPLVEVSQEPDQFQTATPTPVLAPAVKVPTPTPTPEPGFSPKDPSTAALFSVVLPGAGQFYNDEPLKGLVFATLFGLGLWQTLNNLQLVSDASSGATCVAKNETAGNLFGLATLAAYGFGIQDAYNSATGYNRSHNLTLSFGFRPQIGADLTYRF